MIKRVYIQCEVKNYSCIRYSAYTYLQHKIDYIHFYINYNTCNVYVPCLCELSDLSKSLTYMSDIFYRP